MVFLDANPFIIDRFFRRDAVYAANRRFLGRLPDLSAIVPAAILLELCGVASFRLSRDELERWMWSFDSIYSVRILDPFGADEVSAGMWFSSYTEDIERYLARRMTFGDAMLAREADRNGAEAIVTWNVKDFVGRTATAIFTPEQYLARVP